MDSFDLRLQVMHRLWELDAPVVFKGATVLRVALGNCDIGMRVGTKDLDMDWVGHTPTMVELENLMDNALKCIDAICVPVRTLAPHRAAGFRVFRNRQVLFDIDINVTVNPFVCVYATPAGVRFNGASLKKMLADKLSTVSSRLVFRRCKDMYDLYLLSHLRGFKTLEIKEILTNQGVALEGFVEFQLRLAELLHAYEKLRGIEDKPSFDVVYNRVFTFVRPFISNTETALVWTGSEWATLADN